MNLQELLDLDVSVPPDLTPLVPGYLKRREEEIEILVACLERRDYDRIYAIAHKLTGNGAGYGMYALTVIGKELGVAAQAANTTHILELIVNLRKVVQDIKGKFYDQSTLDRRQSG